MNLMQPIARLRLGQRRSGSDREMLNFSVKVVGIPVTVFKAGDAKSYRGLLLASGANRAETQTGSWFGCLLIS